MFHTMVLRDHFQRVTASGLDMNSKVQARTQQGEFTRMLPPKGNSRVKGIHNLAQHGKKSRTQRGNAVSQAQLRIS